MGIYDEQIRARKSSDQENFVDSIYQIAGAVMGRSISEALNDDRIVTTDAVGDILKHYHLKAREVPEEIRDMNEVLDYLTRPHGIMRRTVTLDDEWDRKAKSRHHHLHRGGNGGTDREPAVCACEERKPDL